MLVFLPSGMNYATSDAIDLKFYLPFDFPWSIQKALRLVKPKKIIFSTYDFGQTSCGYQNSKIYILI